MARRLYRSEQHKILGGVCGGLGEHLDIDPTWVRLAFVLLTIAHGLGILLYIIGWIIIPRQETVTTGEPAADASPASQATRPTLSDRKTTSLLPGIILIFIGLVFLARETFWWFDLHFAWPIILVAVGAVLVYRALQKKAGPEADGEVANESR